MKASDDHPSEPVTTAPEAVAPAMHPSLADGVQDVHKLLDEALGNGLLSLCVIGFPVQEGIGKHEPIETVALVDGDLFAHADRIGRLSKKMAKAHVAPPLLMTQTYIERSLDVFPIEFLSMQLLHHSMPVSTRL